MSDSSGKPPALVTGASNGIGYGLAGLCAEHGFDLVAAADRPLKEAARALLRWKTPKTQALHEWATRIAARRGKATAVVALARKLAGLLFALWRDGTEFDPGHRLVAAGS